MKFSTGSIIGNPLADLPTCSAVLRKTSPSLIPLQITRPRVRPGKLTNVCKAWDEFAT